jgi:hypothetical protein
VCGGLKVFMVSFCPPKQMLRWYFEWATTAAFNILSYPSVILPFDVIMSKILAAP